MRKATSATLHSPECNSSFAIAIRQRCKYPIGATPTMLVKRRLKAEREHPHRRKLRRGPWLCWVAMHFPRARDRHDHSSRKPSRKAPSPSRITPCPPLPGHRTAPSTGNHQKLVKVVQTGIAAARILQTIPARRKLFQCLRIRHPESKPRISLQKRKQTVHFGSIQMRLPCVFSRH